MTTLYLGLLAIVILIIYKNKDPKKTSLDLRKMQSSSWVKKNILSKTLERNIGDKVKVTKKMDIEDLCYRAGYILDYYVFLTYRIGFMILSFVFLQLTTGNLVLSITMGLLGFFIPYEYMRILANKRSNDLEGQIGVAMAMIIKRYENTGDMKEAIEKTAVDLYGEEPIYTELTRIIDDINLGESVQNAMEKSSRRIGNKFFERFTAFYGVSSDAGTRETKTMLLGQALEQFKENQDIKNKLKKALREPIITAYIMIGFVPLAVLFGKASNEKYVYIMTRTFPGMIGTTFILISIAFSIWIVNTKLAAPIDVIKKKKKKR